MKAIIIKKVTITGYKEVPDSFTILQPSQSSSSGSKSTSYFRYNLHKIYLHKIYISN